MTTPATLTGNGVAVTFGAPHVDDEGVEWVLESLEGWESPELRESLTERPADHGAYAGAFLYGTRPITVNGWALAASAAQARDARDRLARASTLLDTEGELLVDETPAKIARVRRSGRLLVEPVGTSALKIAVGLVARDPRQYEADERELSTSLPPIGTAGRAYPRTFPHGYGTAGVGGAISAPNLGTFPTRPLLEIAGPVSGPVVELVETGEALRFDLDVTAGEVLTVDTDTRAVTLNGAGRRHTLAAGSSWWQLEPGGNTVRFRAAAYDAAARLTVRYRSAWA